MIKIKVVVIDRTRSAFLKKGESSYIERIEKYVKFQWVEVKSVPIRKGEKRDLVLGREEANIIKRLNPSEFLVALDRSGKQYKSEEFSAWLKNLSAYYSGWVVFVIGGPLGLSRNILNRSNNVLSLSKMTFTHEMSRLILLEQIYRALTIIQGEKYHK